MIEFQATERNGVPVTHAYVNVGDAVATFAGRLYQGDSGKWMVEPSRFTAEQMAEGQFDDQDAARKYVEKCLKEMSVQTTEQEVNQAVAKTRPAPKPGKRAAKQAAVVTAEGEVIGSVPADQVESLAEAFSLPKPPKKRTRVSKAAAEADDVPASRKARTRTVRNIDGALVDPDNQNLCAECGRVIPEGRDLCDEHTVAETTEAKAVLDAIKDQPVEKVNRIVTKAIRSAERPETCPDCNQSNNGWGNRKDGLCEACYCKRIGPCVVEGCTQMAFHKAKKLCKKHLRTKAS